MKHLIIIGSIYPEGFIEDINNKCSYIDYAADTFQRSMLKGLEGSFDKVEFLTYPVFKAKWKKLFRRSKLSSSFSWSKSQIHFTGFINIPVVKKIDELCRIYRGLKKLLLEKQQSYIIIYSLHTPFLLPVFFLRKRIKKIMVVIPDLPEFMGGGTSLLYKFAKTLDRHIINMCVSRFDCFTILSSYMKNLLPINDKPTVVVEGIYSNIIPLDDNLEKTQGVNILYTGLISKRYGVFDLTEAFGKISNQEYSLWLCGSCGTPEDRFLLDKYLEEDLRIRYFGVIPPNKVRSLQRKATLLVNPRHSNEKYTKYSFPSKTMEYLASGTPTLMCKLPAIPEEYGNYLFFFDDETIEGFASKIVEVVNMNEKVLYMRGMAGQSFILNKKNEMIQTSKMLDLLLS